MGGARAPRLAVEDLLEDGLALGARRSKRTPMPGATPTRDGSNSRVQTTVPSPEISGDESWSWNSNRSCVPTASGSLVLMKMPPWLTSTEYRSMN